MLFSPRDNSQSSILDSSLPTLLLFECVLVYMSPSSSSRLLEWFVQIFKRAQTRALGCIVYEMFGLDDAFGRVMLTNLRVNISSSMFLSLWAYHHLQKRQIYLPGAEPYPTSGSLSNRFLQTGFSAARALTLKEIRKSYITSEELERYHGNAFLGTFSLTPILRISRLEFLDETEELDLVLAHYAISWGLFLGNSDMCENWGQWGLKQPE